MLLISAVSGVQIPAPPPPTILSPFLRRWGNMKKLVTLASVGVFLLSLQGASLAQEKAPVTPAAPPLTAPSVTAPVETPATPEATAAPKTKTAKKKSKLSKKAKAAKKAKKCPPVKVEE